MSLSNENGLISVIVPIYKVEDFLDECVKSILNQTYTNFELILVDDGSPDRCGKMCDDYQKRDSRIRVIHKENGGLSDARNAGMKIAKGEYWTFIDSDDMVSADYLEVLMQTAQQYDADIVQGDYTSDNALLGKAEPDTVEVFTREAAMVSFLRMGKVHVSAWAKLYKRSCFAGIEYPKGRINEDKLTIYKNIWISKKIVCVPNWIYYYRLNDNSIMHSNISPKRFEVLSFQAEFDQYFGDEAQMFEQDVKYSQIRNAVWLLNDSITAGKDKELSKEIDWCKSVLKNCWPGVKDCEMKYRVIVPLILHAYPVYRQLARMARK